jgi:two-component system, sensor histidine kinase
MARADKGRHLAEPVARSGRAAARNTPAGQMQAYVNGRLRGFWLRQTLTLIGSLSIWLFASPLLGLATTLIALAGEFCDWLTLRWVNTRLPVEGASPRLVRLATLSGGLQGLTIAACVVLCWHFIPMLEARFFATAFLVAAIINAGLPRPYFRAAADVRLAIYAAVAVVMMALDVVSIDQVDRAAYGFFTAAFGMLIYISVLFIAHVQKFHDQRRRSEAELARVGDDNQRLALVAQYASDSIVFTDTSGVITWVNPAFTRSTGYGFDQAVGTAAGTLLNAPETDPAALDRLAEARSKLVPVRVELLNRTADGRLIWVETSITPILDDNGQHRLSIAVERDITAAKQREGELARARQAAEEAGLAKAQFLANMSHEIRTPMNGVLGVAELLAETPLSPQQADYVETITESGRALLEIINDILDLAKLQSGKAALEQRPLSLPDMLDRVLRILRPAASKKGLGLEFTPPPVPSPLVLGDEGKLRQILMNLVGNALKFTQSGQITLALRYLPGGMVEIDVADTGIGIPPDRLAHIFESFAQADNSIARQFGGTGLGLTISAMLADLMDGGINVRSTIGQGSVFTLRALLPLAEGAALPQAAAAPVVEETLPPGLRILVAEDNRTNMMIMRKFLADRDVTLIEAVNGAEAVDLVEAHTPDLVLMDISMPVMDGLEATRRIRAREAALGLPRLPMLALTANAFGEDRAACEAAGLDGFLVKPLARRDLFAAIRAQMAGTTAPPPPQAPPTPGPHLGL